MPGSYRKELENKWGWQIKFTHVLTGAHETFQSILTDYTDTFTSNWGNEQIYGRMDPLYTFQNTTRAVSLSWDVVSDDVAEAESNLGKFQNLVQMLYPTYKNDNGIKTMDGAPLVRVKFTNLLQDAATAGNGVTSQKGLLGVIKGGLSFNPNLEVGVVTSRTGVIIPKIYSVTCQIGVLHEHDLGYIGNQWVGAESFPYGTLTKKQQVDSTNTALKKSLPFGFSFGNQQRTQQTPTEHAKSPARVSEQIKKEKEAVLKSWRKYTN